MKAVTKEMKKKNTVLNHRRSQGGETGPWPPQNF